MNGGGAAERLPTVRLALDAGVPKRVYLDPLRVHQIIMNGLDNAARHGGGGGRGAGAPLIDLRACVSVAAEGSRTLVIEVLDTGRGLRGRTLAHLSTEFMDLAAFSPPSHPSERLSLQASAYGNARSTGLGLPICVRLAALMGGAIDLTDRDDCDGACAQHAALRCVIC